MTPDNRTQAQRVRDEAIARSANRLGMHAAISALAAIPAGVRNDYVEDLLGRMRRAYRHGLERRAER